MLPRPDQAAVLWLTTLLVLTVGCSGSPPSPAGTTDDAPAPRLIVLVVIDQYRADYHGRFRGRFSEHGFKRLRREGASFTSCFYPYAPTETAPAHATLATGTTPDRHGIVANVRYDARTGRVVPTVEDDAFPLIGGVAERPGASPRRLVGTTFSDELRLFTGGAAKVFSLALKDRAAILSVGHAATGAFWYDIQTGAMISSRYYGEQLPDSVVAFNRGRPADRFYGRTWSVGDEKVVDLTSASGNPDPMFYKRLGYTPYIHDYLIEFARTLIEGEDLGADGVPDLLFIGLSGHDWLGHEVGPYHAAVAEMALHTDALLAEFLSYLDLRLGRTGYWLVLSSDHGVSPSLRQAADRRIHAAAIDQAALREAIVATVTARWGSAGWVSPIGNWTRLRFDRDALARLRVRPEEAAWVAGEAATGVRGILGYVGDGISNVDAATTAAYRLSFYPSRSPDLMIVPEPFALRSGGDVASHGTPYTYDTHVPLILLGPPFRPGRYHERVSPVDLAPTLSAALGMTPPARASGRVLHEALK